MTLTYGELFAGYDGLGLGVRSVLGGTTSWFAEFDKAPSKILAHHYPDVPNLGDVTKIDWHSVPKVDVITGGSPCQDLSHAGKRAGMKAGTRSGLWASMCDAIDIIRPRLVVWENVRGALSAEADSELEHCPGCMGGAGDGGPVLRALGRVLGDLAELGYDARWYGLRAADVGAPHGRFRIFLFAQPADADLAGLEGLGDQAGAAQAGRHGHAESGAGGPDMTLLPTPVSDNSRGLPSSGTDYQSLPNAVVSLLPTPTTTQRGTDANLDTREGARANLHNEVANLADDRHDLVWSDIADAYVRKGDRESIEASILYHAAEASQMAADYDVMDAAEAAAKLLPTPSVADGMGGHLSRSGSRSDELLLPGVAKGLAERWERDLEERARDSHAARNPMSREERLAALRDEPGPLLPTPTSADHKASGSRGYGGNEFSTLTDATVRNPQEWGDYGPAITRWEALTRPAPAPTEPGAKGSPRLSPRFVEWMMGLPEGWVDVEGVSRNEQLKALGNGVVPQQVAAATRAFLADIDAAIEARRLAQNTETT